MVEKTSTVSASLLQQIPIFQSLAPALLRDVASQIKIEKVKSGQIICRVGDSAEEMFVLLAGSLSVYVNKGQVPHKLTYMKKSIHDPEDKDFYPFFGETALVATASFTRSANVKSLEDSILMVIPASVMQTLMEQGEAFYKDILEQAKTNLERSQRLETSLGINSLSVKSRRDSHDHEQLGVSRKGNRMDAHNIFHSPGSLPSRNISNTQPYRRTHSRSYILGLMRSSCLDYPRMVNRLDKFTWDTLTDTVPETELLQDEFLGPMLRGSLAINDMEGFCADVVNIFEEVRVQVTHGHNASYIPILAAVDPSKFAISICTVSGQMWSYGDTEDTFSIQSAVKPYMYAKGIEEHGIKKMREHIGIEPSGLAFNAVTLNRDRRAHNPYGNAGAMTSASLIGMDSDTATRFNDFRSFLLDLAGDELIDFDMATYLCEWETAYRNNAILYTLTQAGAFPRGCIPREALDFYIQCCAVEVNVKSCAVMAASLAAGGECPLSKKKVLCPSTVKNVLTLMYSCGMYDYSGTWSQSVGVPAKSGVAGVIQMVWPNVAGVAIWSPPLDTRGNSVRGIEMSKRLCRMYHMSIFEQSIVNMNGNMDRKGKKVNEAKRATNPSKSKNRRNSQSGMNLMDVIHLAKEKNPSFSPTSTISPSGRNQVYSDDARTPASSIDGVSIGGDTPTDGIFNSPVLQHSELESPASSKRETIQSLWAREMIYERLLLLGELVEAFRRLANANPEDKLEDISVSTDTIRALLLNVGIGFTDKPVPLLSALLKQIATNERVTFKSLFLRGINVEMNMIIKGLLNLLGIHDFNLFNKHITEIYETSKCDLNRDNLVAQKSLVNVFREDIFDMSEFGVAVCTVDGQEIALGDCNKDIPMMETIKPLLYALSMQDSGPEEVHKYVGIEPTSSDPTGFDLLSPTSHGADADGPQPSPTPYNPFTDSGGLVCCSMVGQGHKKAGRFFADKGTRFKHVLNSLRKLAGGRGRCGFANPIFLAQKERGLQVKAVSHYIKGMGCYPEAVDPDSTAEQYFEARAIKTSCQTLAACASTIANGGVCPLTNERCLDSDVVANTIRQMYSSGMNAYAGEWQFSVGIPASSGSSGLMLLVIPKVCGICIYDPQLNDSSVPLRAIEFAKQLCQKYRVNIFDQLVFGNDPNVFNSDENQAATQEEAALIQQDGLRIFELLAAAGTGDLTKLNELIHAGIDVNVADYDSRTALHVACSDNKIESVKILLKAGADPMKLDRWRGTPVDDAKRSGSRELVAIVEGYCNPG